MYKSFPNIITGFRLCTVPVLLYLLHDPDSSMISIALGVFIVAALSDYLDGYLARQWNASSDLGKLLDPLADKLLVLSVLVMLVSLRSDYDGAPWVPAWMVVLVMARELWVTGLRAVAGTRGVVVAAGMSGKIKSLLQMVAVVFLLLHHEVAFVLRGIEFTFQHIGIQCLIASLVFSYWGAFEYTVAVLVTNDTE